MSSKDYKKLYLKYKSKYLYLMYGGDGSICYTENNENYEHETSIKDTTFKNYKLNICSSCDKLIYFDNDNKKWTDQNLDLKLDQADIDTINNPIIKEKLRDIYDRQKEINNENCKKIKDNYYDYKKKLFNPNTNSSAKNLAQGIMNSNKKQYKDNKCTDLIGIDLE